MSLLRNILPGIKYFSIRWKMLILFLFFAFVGTTTIAVFNLRSQRKLMVKEERSLMTGHYKDFQDLLDHKTYQALSIAASFAENPEMGRLLSVEDREPLIKLINPAYGRLNRDFNVSRIMLHITEEYPFLTFPSASDPSDEFTYKKAVSDALTKGISSGCLEKDETGLCIIGVAPVYYDNIIAGCMMICIPCDHLFVEGYYDSSRVNTALYDLKGPGDYRLLAFSGEKPLGLFDEIYPDKRVAESPKTLIGPDLFPGKSVLTGPLKDCSGKITALIELDMDRSEILKSSAETGKIIVMIAVIGIAASFLLAYFIISLLTGPIREIAKEAQDIAKGKREIRLEPRPGDEIGALTDALNSMLDSLKAKQSEIKEYARTLESRVENRTAELHASEEKYRTLVENAPLIVYRVSRDGTTEFVNSYLTENTGYTIEEAMNDRRFWRDKIAGIDQRAFDIITKGCFLEKRQCRIESRVLAKDGRMLTFITHAIPAKDPQGNIKWIDGIMLDITELKRLQEEAIQAEGIRTIGEISARMAHEIRNPLSAAGGFAHRLRESLKNDEVKSKMADIIVEEIAKLENFVKILLSSIEPIDFSLSDMDVNSTLLYWLKDLDSLIDSRNIRFINDFEADMPKIRADREKLSKSIGNILKHAVLSTPGGENIFISTFWLKDQILITLTHRVDRVTASDMDKFFFPHIESDMDKSLLDLPLSKIIIQRHGGRIDLIREEGDVLILKIKFPVSKSIDEDDSKSTD